jgi:molybdopterin-guanine dinucleotide biosynthesis protein A
MARTRIAIISAIGNARLKATLCVLAGGESRRMGRPKALLPVGSTTLLEWVIDRLEPHFDEVLVSLSKPPAELPATLTAKSVFDLHPQAGPLAGVEAALAGARNETVFVVACDMPRVTPALARALVAASAGHDAAVPRIEGRPEPACAAYRRGASGPVGAALRADRRQAAEALADLDVRYLDEDELAAAGAGPHTFANLNTQADYRYFLEGLRRRG